MATVTFSNGKKINFNGNPTPQDIEEVSQKFGMSATPASSPTPQGSTQTDATQPKVGLMQGLIRGIASPVLRGVANIATLGDLGNQAAYDKDNSQGVSFGDYLGSYRPIGATKDAQGNDLSFGKRLADTVGTGLEGASFAIPGSEAVEAAGEGATGAIGAATDAAKAGRFVKAAKIGASEGATIGGLAGAGQGLQDPNGDTASTLVSTGIGAVGGGLTGGLLGGAGGLIGKANSASRSAAAVEDNLSDLSDIESKNKSVANAIAKAKDSGVDAKNIIANTDMMRGSVDSDGTLRTKQEGGVLSQYQKFMDNKEGMIRANLVKEGKTMPLADVESALKKTVNKSGLEGSSLTAAHNQVRAEIEGYKYRTLPDGTIPLSSLQDAKVSKYRTLNYDNPESQQIGKTIASGLKDVIEKNTSSIGVKNLNKELGGHYATMDVLEALDGKKVKGGRLGKYVARTIGGMAGSHLGPVGTLVGADIADRIQGSILKNTFNNGLVGKGLTESPEMIDAIERANGLRRKLPVKSEPSAYTNELPTIDFGKTAKPKAKIPSRELPIIR